MATATQNLYTYQSIKFRGRECKKSMPFLANVVIQMNFDMNEIIIITIIVGICKLQWNSIAIK